LAIRIWIANPKNCSNQTFANRVITALGIIGRIGPTEKIWDRPERTIPNIF
jgi:hypothetical protein